MKFAILGSGSSGNSTFVNVKGYKILIDVGFSCKKIEEKLASIGENLANISAILITHEHVDHVAGAKVIAKKYNIPIYITRESFIEGQLKFGDINKNLIKFIEGDFILDNKISVMPFDVMHDAARTIGFRLETELGKSLAISTDIGCVNNLIKEYFKLADAVIIESNYDHNKLMTCSYPWNLKERIKSRNGHLSNLDSARFLKEICGAHLQKAFLSHISKESNDKNLIISTFNEELDKMIYRPDYEIVSQDLVTDIFEIK